MKSAEIKKFFKTHFNIPVRVRTVQVKRKFVQVWIPVTPVPGSRELRHEHSFPPELGRQLLKIIYPNSPTLHNQAWAGNIAPHSLSLDGDEWAKLKALYEG